MKYLLNVFFLFLLFNISKGQSMDTLLQKIIDHKLLKTNQIKEFEELRKQNEMKTTNAAYLYALYQIELKKLKIFNYSAYGTHFVSFYPEKPLTKIEQEKINQELSLYFSKLQSCGLIDEKQFGHFTTKINQNAFTHSLQIFPSLIESVLLKEYMNPEKLKTFAEQLKNGGLLSINFERLILDIEQEKWQFPTDLLPYFDRTAIIDEHEYPEEPKKYLELIHQKTASAIPLLTFTQFEFEVLLDSQVSDKNGQFYDFVVSLQSNGKKYRHKSHYRWYDLRKNQYVGNKIGQYYHRIFNKILADLSSPYRLHQVEIYQENKTNPKKFGILALTEEQAELLRNSGYFTISEENFKSKFNSQRIEQILEEYQKMGLFSHLTVEQFEKAKEKVVEQENTRLNALLEAMPDMIYFFDTELEDLQNPYANLVRELIKISHQDFHATEIADNFDLKNEKVEVKFKIGSKQYNKTLQINNDWVDGDFFDFINSVVAENQLKGQFYELYTGGQETSLIYLTKEQYEYLKNHKLLVFADQWETAEMEDK